MSAGDAVGPFSPRLRIAVFGLGRLGLPWSLVALAAGHEVVSVDQEPAKVRSVNSRQARSHEPGVNELLADPACRLTATVDPGEALAGSDVTYVAVPTPSQPDGSFDASSVLAVIDQVVTCSAAVRLPHLVVVASTLSPGTMVGPVAERVSRAGLSSDIALAYVPEFHAIGSVLHDLRHPPLSIVGADEPSAARRASELLTGMSDCSPRRMGATEAELAKLALNGMLTLRISYANHLAEIATAYPDVDVTEVCRALEDDPRVGRGFLRPGPPYGGPCLPRDVPALEHLAQSAGVPGDLWAAVGAVNERRFRYLVDKVTRERDPGRPLGIAGISFKAGASDVEGSPGLELARRLTAAGQEVLAYDPDAFCELPAGAHWARDVEDLCTSSGVVLLLAESGAVRDAVLSAVTGGEHPPRIIDAWGAAPGVRRYD